MRAKLSAKDLVRPCSRCGFMFSTARDKCPSCALWNRGTSEVKKTLEKNYGVKKFSEGENVPLVYIPTGIVDNILGGGISETAVYLLGGGYGAGKSTITLQILAAVAKHVGREGLYIGLEETEGETIGRARRLGLDLDSLLLYPNTATSSLFEVVAHFKPSMLIIDSIGKVASNPADEVEVAKALKKDIATMHRCPVLIIAHVTKDQVIAGMNDLPHEVDCVMTFFPTRDRKGPRDEPPRELEVTKNRMHPTGCVTYSMAQGGLIERPENWTEGSEEKEEEKEEGEDEDDEDAA